MNDDPGVERVKQRLRERMRDAGLSLRETADLAALNVGADAPEVTYDERYLRYLLGDRRALPPRVELEPVATAVGLSWDQVLRLL